jgi:hypothetical protein
VAAGIALTRRVFLSLIAAASVLRLPAVGRAAERLPAPLAHGDELVVVRGWVLRRDDLDRMPSA